GPGDADDVQVPARVAPVPSGQGSHGGPHGRHHHLGDVDGEGALDEEGDGSGVDHVGGEVVAVDPAARHAAEQDAGEDRVGAVDDAGDLDVAAHLVVDAGVGEACGRARQQHHEPAGGMR